MKQFESILRRLKNGEDQAFKDLVFSYSSQLLTTARLYCYQSRQAEDILQEAFIVIFQKIKGFEGKNEGALKAWMKTIVINKAFNANRKSSVSKEILVDSFHNDVVIDSQSMSNLSYDEIMNLVLNLSNGYRQVFALSVLEGYSHKEIGDKLNITPSTSRSQLNRAKKQLQNKIQSLSKIAIS